MAGRTSSVAADVVVKASPGTPEKDNGAQPGAEMITRTKPERVNLTALFSSCIDGRRGWERRKWAQVSGYAQGKGQVEGGRACSRVCGFMLHHAVPPPFGI